MGAAKDEDSERTAETKNNKQLVIQIQGSVFDTGETRVRLMDLIRSSADIDDFQYLLVGGQ